MKMKILVGALVFLIAINLATIGTNVYYNVFRNVEQQMRDFPPGAQPPLPLRNLGSKERVQLLELMKKFHDETRDLRDSARDMEREMSKIILENPVSQDKLDAKLQDIARLRMEISKKAAARFIEAKSFLAPGQQELFFGAIMQAHPGMEGPPPGGPRRGGPPHDFRFRDGDSMRDEPPPPPPGGGQGE